MKKAYPYNALVEFFRSVSISNKFISVALSIVWRKVVWIAFVVAVISFSTSGYAVQWASSVTLSSGGAIGSTFGDFDGDGRAEYVTTATKNSSDPHFRIHDWNPSTSSFTPYNVMSSSAVNGRQDRFGGDLAVADIDNDGWLDIIVPESDNASGSGRVSWFENPNGNLGGTWTEHVVSIWNNGGTGNSAAHMSEVAVGDIDGNGWDDIVVRDISHGFWVLMRQNGGSGWHSRKYVPTNPREGLQLHDVDEDGDLDVFLNGVWFQTPSDPVNGTYLQQTIFSAWYPSGTSSTTVANYACQVEIGDFNGDGRADYIITNSEELSSTSTSKPKGIDVFLAPSNPITGTWTRVTVRNDHYSWHSCELGDIDGDNDLDFVSGISQVGVDNATGQIIAFLNDGSGSSFTQESISTNSSVYIYQASLADADGDGDLDLLAPDNWSAGSVRYFANLSQTGGSTIDPYSRVEAEDYSSQSGLGIYTGGTGQKIGSIENGTWASYFNVDFGNGATSVTASAASNTSGGTIQFRLGSTTGTLVGSMSVTGTGGWDNFQNFQTTISGASGEQDLYLVFVGGSGALLDVDYFEFSTSGGSAPAAPGSLSVSAISASQVNLSWSDNSSNETGFKIERKTGAGSYSQIATVGANVTTFSDTSVAAQTTYTYRVRATNANGDSSYSNEDTETTPSGSGSIDPYSRVEAEDYASQSGLGIYSGGTGEKIGSIENGTWASYANVDFGSGAASVTASAASNTSGGTIQFRLGSTSGTLVGSISVPGTGGWDNFQNFQTTISGATGQQTLYLVFVGGSGSLLDVDYFQFSTSGGGGDTTAPSVPSGLVASNETSTTVDLDWNASTDNSGGTGVAGYYIYTGGSNPVDVGNTTSVTVSGLSPSTSYTFTVSAYDGASNESAQSSGVSVTTGSGGGTSTNLAEGKTVVVSSTQSPYVAANAVDGNGTTRWGSSYSDNQWIYVDLGETANITEVVLDWETAYGTQYDIQVSADASNWTTVYSETSGNGGLDEITLNASGRYVRMQGVDRATHWGYSLWEFEVWGTIGGGSGDTTAPSVPTGLASSNVTATTVDLDWNASTDNSGGTGVAGYYVYINGSNPMDAGNSTSVTVSGLTPSTSYTFTVSAYDGASNESGQQTTGVTETTSASSGPLISEDFSSGASSFTAVAGGTWSVSSGRYVLTSPSTGSSTGVLGNISVHGTSLTGNYVVTALMNITGTSSDWNDATIVFGYQDINNYYYVSLNESNDGNTKGVFKVVSGVPTELADISISVAANTDYSIEVQRTGSAIVVLVNSAQVASVSDATFSGGLVGFGSYNDGAGFDNLVVTE